MHSMAPRPCFFICSRARSVRYFFIRSQLTRCCQSNPAMPKFAVPMVSPELKPRGSAVDEKFQPAVPYRRGPYCSKSLRDREARGGRRPTVVTLIRCDQPACSPFEGTLKVEDWKQHCGRSRPCPDQLASCPGSALSPAASMPAMAQASSRSDVSPDMPTAPMMAPGERARSEAHAERAPGLADGDVEAQEAGLVLALERDQVPAPVQHGDGERRAIRVAAFLERGVDDGRSLGKRNDRHMGSTGLSGRALARMISDYCFARFAQ